ncbi:MAG: hypothetical protein WC202_12750, partial [Desulfobacterales bacterium]
TGSGRFARLSNTDFIAGGSMRVLEWPDVLSCFAGKGAKIFHHEGHVGHEGLKSKSFFTTKGTKDTKV